MSGLCHGVRKGWKAIGVRKGAYVALCQRDVIDFDYLYI